MEPLEYETLRRQEGSFWWYRGLHRLIGDRVGAALDTTFRSTSPAHLLDAGCGSGGMLAHLATRFGPRVDLTGIDVSPLALRPAAERKVARLARGSVDRLPFADASFELIVSLDVLYHRAVADDLEAMRELRRCLRPGGRLLLHLPAFESLRSAHDEAIHTARRYRRRPLRELLVRAGLTPHRVTYRNSLLFPALATVRAWRRRETGGGATPLSDVRPAPPLVDTLLGSVLEVERRWLRLADLPWGLSLLAEASRPEDS